MHNWQEQRQAAAAQKESLDKMLDFVQKSTHGAAAQQEQAAAQAEAQVRILVRCYPINGPQAATLRLKLMCQVFSVFTYCGVGMSERQTGIRHLNLLSLDLCW